MKMSMGQNGSSKVIRIFYALVALALAAGVAFFVYSNVVNPASKFPFRFGLDLAGGSQLVYVADVDGVQESDIPQLMDVLRQVIERRINVLGVSEPVVQVESSSVVAGPVEQRLIIELPGVTDIDEAIKSIGQTPLLEFKLVNDVALTSASSTDEADKPAPYIETGLTGRYLERAELVFGQGQGGLSNQPIVSLKFTDEGATLFEQITRENTGKLLAIFLDGEVISSPQINEPIAGGQAVIQGNFTAVEARDLVQNLNFGALPVPIHLDSTNLIGSSLGDQALNAGVYAGLVGFMILSIFMILWYRLPGLVAVVALVIYAILMLALFQFIPVVLTAAGIAGFILSIGMAVDANILIAERIKEEIRAGKNSEDAVREGFARAWLAIRDANITSIIAALILFWFGTSLIKGFALVFGIGIFVSMLSAITISRTLLLAVLLDTSKPVGRFLMSSGFVK